ncbi:MAG: AAA family ATPase [Thermoguttaceae bacterium]|jgi:general secretion pathway protein A
MYESYWQLRQKPFDNTVDPQFYFPSQSHQAALLKLRYAVENRRGGALLAGPAGTGKTLVAAMLRTMLGETFSPFVRLVYPQMSTSELMAYLADELTGSPQASCAGLHDSVRRIEHALVENARQGRHAVVLVDEAHLIESSHTFETLRLLLNFGAGGAPACGSPAMTLLLSGQPGILPILDRLPQLEERLGVKCLLRPLGEQETADYVAHRLRAAGATRAIIEPEAIPTLFELTRGVARQINRLCDLALLIGFAEERQTLGAAHFEAVCHELVAVMPE